MQLQIETVKSISENSCSIIYKLKAETKPTLRVDVFFLNHFRNTETTWSGHKIPVPLIQEMTCVSELDLISKMAADNLNSK